MIHVFIGTKAQYVKTAPLLRLMDERGIQYNLIDSGQHARLSEALRQELRVRPPDVFLRSGGDISTVGQLLGWFIRHLFLIAFAPRRIFKNVFRGENGICIVHGDTPTTLLSVWMAKRAGLKVAHIEAGLRSFSYINPFPEELIRIIAMKMADVLFAPSAWAAGNLRTMKVRGRVVKIEANTGVEAMFFSMKKDADLDVPKGDFGLFTIHRVETILSKKRLASLVGLVAEVSKSYLIIFVVHEPTRIRLEKAGYYSLLKAQKNVLLLPLLPHNDFLHLLRTASFAITDGGSIQEECAYLGLPCVVLRKRTERRDGLGRNAMLAGLDREKVMRFLANLSKYRKPPLSQEVSPSLQILRCLNDVTRAQKCVALHD
ncbi:UDP-N-acetylglucosamine 2-epimerase [bacterium]|nr:UDP-N-acetylglucosamine 2-epimerase [bacterium]